MKNAVILAADRACGHDDVPFSRQIEYLTKKYDARICRLHSKRMDVSSQLLRQKIQNGEQVSGYIPDPVVQLSESVGSTAHHRIIYRDNANEAQNYEQRNFSIREKLKASLKPGRYEHSLSVSFTCMALAMRYGYDLDKAELAGLLHDSQNVMTITRS